ncbi:acyltransferase [Neobacillus sp. K501]
MYFELLLDAIFGNREILHEMECSICGSDEIYYIHPETKESLGRACKKCNFVQKFDFENSHSNNSRFQ